MHNQRGTETCINLSATLLCGSQSNILIKTYLHPVLDQYTFATRSCRQKNQRILLCEMTMHEMKMAMDNFRYTSNVLVLRVLFNLCVPVKVYPHTQKYMYVCTLHIFLRNYLCNKFKYKLFLIGTWLKTKCYFLKSQSTLYISKKAVKIHIFH